MAHPIRGIVHHGYIRSVPRPRVVAPVSTIAGWLPASVEIASCRVLKEPIFMVVIIMIMGNVSFIDGLPNLKMMISHGKLLVITRW